MRTHDRPISAPADARRMRILIFDYSGHPFQVQLSRELARRGHRVRHVFSAEFQTPKGNLAVQADDPDGFEIVPLRNSRPFAKGTFVRRRGQEIETGRLVAAQVRQFVPDVVVSSNAPLDTPERIFTLQINQTSESQSGDRGCHERKPSQWHSPSRPLLS
jgi:hypothetical protein